MGYNSNLSSKANKQFNNRVGKRHPLWIIGTILRIIGIATVALVLIMMINLGGLGFLVLLHPASWFGILALAFGQYFVSNWKYK